MCAYSSDERFNVENESFIVKLTVENLTRFLAWDPDGSWFWIGSMKSAHFFPSVTAVEDVIKAGLETYPSWKGNPPRLWWTGLNLSHTSPEATGVLEICKVQLHVEKSEIIKARLSSFEE